MSFWKAIIENFNNCLFPVFCLQCKKEGEWWCEKCITDCKNTLALYCPVCHLKNDDGKPCFKCKAETSLNGVAAFFDYDEQSIIGQLIKKFKYGFVYDIGSTWEIIANLYIKFLITNLKINSSSFCVIPVPLHKKRFKERGFNQAEIMAEKIIKNFQNNELVCLDKVNLSRQKQTKQQAKLNRVERIQNLKDAFIWSGKVVAPKTVLLIDDVYTSGTTMNECAKILKKNGTQKVYGIVIARD